MMLSPEHQARLLDAYWDGDGTTTESRRCFDTSSDLLAQQVYDLLVRCGHLPSWSRHERNNQGPRNRDKMGSSNRVAYVPDPRYTNGRRANGEGYYSAKITEVERLPYSGPVYNLKVTGDESYVANGRIVHNCSHALASQYEAQSQEFGGGSLTEQPSDLLRQATHRAVAQAPRSRTGTPG
jgi:intein/homing endonuclease